jgi:hypothetical protein
VKPAPHLEVVRLDGVKLHLTHNATIPLENLLAHDRSDHQNKRVVLPIRRRQRTDAPPQRHRDKEKKQDSDAIGEVRRLGDKP